MPRYRKLHVKTVESLDINDMPDDFARLFWVLLPLVLCREGRGLDSPTWLRSRLFPLREDVTTDQVADAFDWFRHRGMIVPYRVDGRGYFYVPSFHKYQGNTIKEAESNYPPPESEVQTSSGASPELVESKSATDADAICNSQYSDADATATTDPSAPAVADVLQELFDLGVKGKKASSLIATYQQRGELPELVPRMAANIEHYRGRDGIKNHIGLAITETESGRDPPAKGEYWAQFVEGQDRRRWYTEGEYADIIEH